MVKIIFTIHDERTETGYRTVEHEEPSLELAIDYMHKYHNRCTGWYRWEEDGKRFADIDMTGVIK